MELIFSQNQNSNIEFSLAGDNLQILIDGREAVQLYKDLAQFDYTLPNFNLPNCPKHTFDLPNLYKNLIITCGEQLAWNWGTNINYSVLPMAIYLQDMRNNALKVPSTIGCKLLTLKLFDHLTTQLPDTSKINLIAKPMRTHPVITLTQTNREGEELKSYYEFLINGTDDNTKELIFNHGNSLLHMNAVNFPDLQSTQEKALLLDRVSIYSMITYHQADIYDSIQDRIDRPQILEKLNNYLYEMARLFYIDYSNLIVPTDTDSYFRPLVWTLADNNFFQD